jgi:hypothetical protein
MWVTVSVNDNIVEPAYHASTSLGAIAWRASSARRASPSGSGALARAARATA